MANLANLNRTNGMIWIDRDSPYRLKYHIHDEDYIVETTVTYKTIIPKNTTKSLPVGTVVKLGDADQVVEAKFPMDLSNVLGVILATETVAASEVDQIVPISVGKLGSIIIPKTELPNVFVPRDLDGPNFKATLTPLLGAPVYWDCGYVGLTQYIAPVGGKLTVQTPSGFKYHAASLPADYKLNIGYNNLPQVGNIVNISDDAIEIHLNFSTFDSTIEWYWPAIGSTQGLLSAGQDQSLMLYHGLFAPTAITADNQTIETTVQCPCKAVAQIIKNNNGSSITENCDLLVHFEHNIENSYTVMSYSIPEDLTHVYVSGEVIYGFNKYIQGN